MKWSSIIIGLSGGFAAGCIAFKKNGGNLGSAFIVAVLASIGLALYLKFFSRMG